MNTSRFREVIDLLLAKETQFKIQETLNQLNDRIANLVGNPQQAEFQTQYAESFEKLRKSMIELVASFQPAQIKLLEEIGADKFYNINLAEQIASWTSENPLSPAVTQQKLSKLVAERARFIDDITQVRDRLKRLNVRASKLDEGTAEIGFLIPRDLFQNELEPLIKELGVINRIIKTVAECTTGSVDRIEVRDISTTDPQFFLGIDPTTVAAIGGFITWALMQWKVVEEIRKLRSETKKNSSFTEKEVKDFFDSKIERTIKDAISEKVQETIGDSKSPRDNEKRNQLSWALESILARVERGMTVEIKFLPPAKKTLEGATEPIPEPVEFGKLREISQQLVFPPAEATPVLEIPPPEPEKARPAEQKEAKEAKPQKSSS